MNFETINMGGYNLHLIKTNKFKTITIDVDFYRNIKKEEITERNLLKMVLLYSSNNYKTERDLIIESENLLVSFRNGKETFTYIKLKPDGSTKEETKVLSEYIRHQIHHPENPHNRRFTNDELQRSIGEMRSFIEANK